MSDNLYATVIAGLMAIIERGVAAGSTEAAEAIGAGLSAGSHELRVAVVIRGDSTEMSAGIAERATGRVVHIVTNTVPTIWPGEFTGTAVQRH